MFADSVFRLYTFPMNLPEQQLPSGLIIVSESGVAPPTPPLPSDFTERVPNHSCYPLGQYVRYLTELAGDPGVAADIGRNDIDIDTMRSALKLAQEDAIANCSRACQNGCALAVIKAARDSKLELVIDISESERRTLNETLSFLELCIPEDEDAQLSEGAQHVRGVVSKRLDIAAEASDLTMPEVDDAAYAFLSAFTGKRFHSILRLVQKLVETSVEQREGKEGLEFALDDPARISVDDIVRLLLQPDGDFHFYLNMGSTPKSEI